MTVDRPGNGAARLEDAYLGALIADRDLKGRFLFHTVYGWIPRSSARR